MAARRPFFWGSGVWQPSPITAARMDRWRAGDHLLGLDGLIDGLSIWLSREKNTGFSWDLWDIWDISNGMYLMGYI